MRILRLCLVALTLCTLAPLAAHAQAPNLSDKERGAKAREAYDAGKRAYNLGDFDQAIKLWKEGYEFKDDPIFLYNIAQAYRQLKDFQKAIFYYKGYLREKPTAENRTDIEAKIAELQKMLDEQQNAAESPPRGITPPGGEKGTVPDKATHPETPPPGGKGTVGTNITTPPPVTSAAPGKGMKIGGIVTMSAGGVLLVTGIVFALKASSTAGDLEAFSRSGQPWTQAQTDQESSGKTQGTVGAVTVTLGTVALVGGGVLFYLGMRKDAKAVEQAMRHVEPVVGPKTAGVNLKWSF